MPQAWDGAAWPADKRWPVFTWDEAVVQRSLPLAPGASLWVASVLRGECDCARLELRLTHSRDHASVDDAPVVTISRMLRLPLGLRVGAGLRLVGFDVQRGTAAATARLVFTVANDAERTAFVLTPEVDGAEVATASADGGSFVDSQATGKVCVSFPRGPVMATEEVRGAEAVPQAEVEAVATEIVERVVVRWRAVSHVPELGRGAAAACGTLNLRGLKLTEDMAARLRAPPLSFAWSWSVVPIAACVECAKGAGPAGGVVALRAGEYYTLRLQIQDGRSEMAPGAAGASKTGRHRLALRCLHQAGARDGLLHCGQLDAWFELAPGQCHIHMVVVSFRWPTVVSFAAQCGADPPADGQAATPDGLERSSSPVFVVNE
jgi:hypothetical protein